MRSEKRSTVDPLLGQENANSSSALLAATPIQLVFRVFASNDPCLVGLCPTSNPVLLDAADVNTPPGEGFNNFCLLPLQGANVEGGSSELARVCGLSTADPVRGAAICANHLVLIALVRSKSQSWLISSLTDWKKDEVGPWKCIGGNSFTTQSPASVCL